MPGPNVVVTVHVWTLRPAHSAYGIGSAALASIRLRAGAGRRFARLLGTGKGDRFTLRDTRLRTWALVSAWDDADIAARFDQGSYVRRWQRRSSESARLLLSPLAARGRWGGHEPFGDPAPNGGPAFGGASDGSAWSGPVAALTRARIAPKAILTFWRAVPPVAESLHASTGCRVAIGIGEAPLGWQGTFSVWDDAAAMNRFAYRNPAHLSAIERTKSVGWYAEELFARFAVLEAEGSIGGRGALAALSGVA
jgi:hypothetical protein